MPQLLSNRDAFEMGSLSHADNIMSKQNSILPANHGGWAAGGHGEGEGFQLHPRLVRGDEGHGDAAQDPEVKLLPVILGSSLRPRRQQPTAKGSRPSLRRARWRTRRMKSVFDEFKYEGFVTKPRMKSVFQDMKQVTVNKIGHIEWSYSR